MRFLGGILMIALGVLLLAWIGYNFLIEMQPEAKGRNPLPALAFSCCLIFVGVTWIRPKKDDAKS